MPIEGLPLQREEIIRQAEFFAERADIYISVGKQRDSISQLAGASILLDCAAMFTLAEAYNEARIFYFKSAVEYLRLGNLWGLYPWILSGQNMSFLQHREDFGLAKQHISMIFEAISGSVWRDFPIRMTHDDLLALWLLIGSDVEADYDGVERKIGNLLMRSDGELLGYLGMPSSSYAIIKKNIGIQFEAPSLSSIGTELEFVLHRRDQMLQSAKADTFHWQMLADPMMLLDGHLTCAIMASIRDAKTAAKPSFGSPNTLEMFPIIAAQELSKGFSQ